MSGRTVEIASVPIRPDVNLTAADSEARTAWDSAMNLVAEQPGVLSLYWGLQIEHPNIVQMVVVWDVIDSQEAFTAGPDYLPFVGGLKDVLGGPPSLFNVLITNSSVSTDSPFAEPVTEVTATHFEPSSTHYTASYTAKFAQLQAEVGKLPQSSAKGITGGWSLGTVHGESVDEVQDEVFATFIGWSSLEAHETFAVAEDFKKAVAKLGVGIKKKETVHVAFTQVK